MGNPAFTIKAFGIYVVLTGLGLLLVPNLMLGLLGVAEAREIWIRVLGALAIVLGYYYIACAAAHAHAFFRATIHGRVAFFALGLGLVLLAGAPWTLILFGMADLAGAAWTWAALRAEAVGPGTVAAS